MRNLLLALPLLFELVNCITIPHQVPLILPIDEDANHSEPHSNKLLAKFKSGPSWTSSVRNKVVERIFGSPPTIAGKRHGRGNHPHSQSQHPLVIKPSQFSRFANDVVLRFNISSVEEARALAEASEVMFMDVWSATSEHVDIRMNRNVVKSFLGLLPDSLHTAHALLIHDLAASIRETFPGAQSPIHESPLNPISSQVTNGAGDIFFNDYQSLSVINHWMKLLVSLFPDHVSSFSIGTSHEGREIRGLKISSAKQATSENIKRKAVVVTGAAHAREWISVSTVCYLAYNFIIGYSPNSSETRDKQITELVDAYDWYFIPTVNVDGYAYTWEEDRLWRKNRQPTALAFCKGIEVDRNYGYKWESQKQSNPCSESYPGKEAFEALEAQHLATWMKNLTTEGDTKLLGFLDFHSYSQQILYPYSYSCDDFPPDLENLEELAIGMSKAIRVRHGEHYQVSSACEGGGWFRGTTTPSSSSSSSSTFSSFSTSFISHSTPSKPRSTSKSKTHNTNNNKNAIVKAETGGGGSALDYFYNEGVSYSYQIKLRDTGSYGFLLPSVNIRPTGEESVSMVKYFGEFLLGKVGGK